MSAGDKPPAGVRRVVSPADAAALADHLLVPGRKWPTVVLTIAGGQIEPFGDPEEIKQQVGDLAEVVLIPTIDVSWAFSRAMPSMTQVYGGAGRVYPVDHGWVNDPTRSRLRFAYSAQDRARITEQLINDALGAALEGGALTLRTSPGLRWRSGSVAGVIGSRAVVTLDDGSLATVWEELTLPGVGLDRVLIKGQAVTGIYDSASRRLNLQDQVRFTDAGNALAVVLAGYDVGDVLLADVTEVTTDAVRLRLLPGLSVTVDRAEVTSNPRDTLSDLFTLGEVVRCRIASAQPLALRLDDIDEDETPRDVLSLLPGGPPWLSLAETDPTAVAVDPAPPIAVPPIAVPEPVQVPVVLAPARRPSPLDLARKAALGTPGPRVQPDSGVVPRVQPDSGVVPRVQPDSGVPRVQPGAGMLERERTRSAELSNELAAERSTRNALSSELNDLRARAAALEAEVDRSLRSAEQLKTRYRRADLRRQQLAGEIKAAQSKADQAAASSGPAFLDPEDQFRHEVYCAWALRVPAADKGGTQPPEYELGPEFLESVDQVEGVSRSKIVAVVVDVLTGQVLRLPGRDAHQLRAGEAGSKYVTRPDGATCWRVALQQNTAGARRLHYWRLRDRYEFSRVVLHDDYRP